MGKNIGLVHSLVTKPCPFPHFYLNLPFLCPVVPVLLGLASLPSRLYPQCGTLSQKDLQLVTFIVGEGQIAQALKILQNTPAFSCELKQAKAIAVPGTLLKLPHCAYQCSPIGCYGFCC